MKKFQIYAILRIENGMSMLKNHYIYMDDKTKEYIVHTFLNISISFIYHQIIQLFSLIIHL